MATLIETEGPMALDETLFNCYTYNATNARDMVYGVLGLVKGVEKLGVQVDY